MVRDINIAQLAALVMTIVQVGCILQIVRICMLYTEQLN